MKVMVFVQIDPKDETGAMPSEELLAAIGAYNEELVKAGIMLDVGGLKPTSEGTRVAFYGGTTSVVDGPFTESKEIVVGYWVWEVVVSFGSLGQRRAHSTASSSEATSHTQ